VSDTLAQMIEEYSKLSDEENKDFKTQGDLR